MRSANELMMQTGEVALSRPLRFNGCRALEFMTLVSYTPTRNLKRSI